MRESFDDISILRKLKLLEGQEKKNAITDILQDFKFLSLYGDEEDKLRL